jgi:lactoylglutathione lyase
MNGLNVRVGVILFVEDIAKMVSFYKNVMEFDTDWDGGLWAEFKTKRAAIISNV